MEVETAALIATAELGKNVASYQATASHDTEDDGSGAYFVDANVDMIADDEEVSVASGDGGEDLHKTTYWQTYIHLLKGYIGCGVLSLPWAVSQLGIPVGCLAIGIMAYWSSYNCWTVVRLKRYMQKTAPAPVIDDAVSESPSQLSSANTNITYPDVGDWAFGKDFQTYIAGCICTQQLAICTVFLSFIGENVLAVLEFCGIFRFTHFTVLSLGLPFVMGLSFLPSLRSLAPVMAAGTILMLSSFLFLAYIGWLEWDYRPDEVPEMNPKTAPLALCAILYSYEGICLVLPVESAMEEPKHFKSAFTLSMASVAAILALVAALSVLVFGDVTNGSITAFLLEAYKDETSITLWLMLANTAASLSILLTYPLQLFPALELLGPIISNYNFPWQKPSTIPTSFENELDLNAFEPLPTLPEHDTASLGSLPSEFHDYGNDDTVDKDDEASDVSSRNQMSSMGASVTSFLPPMTMPGDSYGLRISLVLLTYVIAAVVPNVQSLISLAGAVAGSSTALLIPPVLELAWIRRLEKDRLERETRKREAAEKKDENGTNGAGDQAEGALTSLVAPLVTSLPPVPIVLPDKYFWAKVKSWVLLFLGIVFALIGSFASIRDIIRIYSGP